MNEEREKLIAEIRAEIEHAAHGTPENHAAKIRSGEVDDTRLRLLVKAADALEAPLTETEWEYGVDTDRTWEGHPVMGVGQSLDEAKANVLKYAPRGTRFTNPRRRRKGREAGEWEVVPDDAEV